MIKLKKRWAAGMAAVSMAAFMACGSTTPVFAQSNENAGQKQNPVVVVEETITEGTKEEENNESETSASDRDVSGALTPNGNLTLVDDLDEEASGKMQFMTVTTRDGSYYYIVIDRSGSSENVYFLNAVDTIDLMNLMSDEEKAQLEESKDPEAENVITPEVTISGQEEKPDPEPETVPEKENQVNSALPMLGIFAAIGALIAGAYYMLKIRPKKNRTGIDEDREFYDDDGYENEDEVPEEEENETEE